MCDKFVLRSVLLETNEGMRAGATEELQCKVMIVWSSGVYLPLQHACINTWPCKNHLCMETSWADHTCHKHANSSWSNCTCMLKLCKKTKSRTSRLGALLVVWSVLLRNSLLSMAETWVSGVPCPVCTCRRLPWGNLMILCNDQVRRVTTTYIDAKGGPGKTTVQEDDAGMCILLIICQ